MNGSRMQLPGYTFIAPRDWRWVNTAMHVANYYGLHEKIRRLSSIVDVTSNSMNIIYMMEVELDQAHEDILWLRVTSPYSRLRLRLLVDYATGVVLLSEVHDQWIYFI